MWAVHKKGIKDGPISLVFRSFDLNPNYDVNSTTQGPNLRKNIGTSKYQLSCNRQIQELTWADLAGLRRGGGKEGEKGGTTATPEGASK